MLEQRREELSPTLSRAAAADRAFSGMSGRIAGSAARGVITRIDERARRIEVEAGRVILGLPYNIQIPFDSSR